MIPSTHEEALDPRWDLLLAENGRPLRDDFMNSPMKKLDDKYFNMAAQNQKVRSEVEDKVVEILGVPGDIYFFLNDTWHGRFGNKNSNKLMIARVGGFPTDFAFKDDIPLPGSTDVLPETLQRLYRSDQPVNTDNSTLVNRMKQRSTKSPLWKSAADEKIELCAQARVEFAEKQASGAR